MRLCLFVYTKCDKQVPQSSNTKLHEPASPAQLLTFYRRCTNDCFHNNYSQNHLRI